MRTVTIYSSEVKPSVLAKHCQYLLNSESHSVHTARSVQYVCTVYGVSLYNIHTYVHMSL